MRYVKLPMNNRNEFLNAMKPYGNLYGPVKISDSSYDFREISDVHTIDLDYTRTILPPRKYFFPPKEDLFTFDKEDCRLIDAYVDEGSFVLFGVHSCDIIGLRILDSRFIDDRPDPYYLKRRENGIIIGIDCEPDEYCFCNLRDADFAERGFDLFLHEIDGGYLIRVGSKRAQDHRRQHRTFH